MKKFLMLIIILSFFMKLIANEKYYELLELSGIPTAGILHKGETEIRAKVFSNNGLLPYIRAGVFDNFMFGISFGAENLVGYETPDFQEIIGVTLKYRIFDESSSSFALALGFDNQGHGKYYKDEDRYSIKSKGFYAVVSKNYDFWGNLGLHSGLNLSTEKTNGINFFIGLNKSFGSNIVLLVDYSAPFDESDSEKNEENNNEDFSSKKGYLNSGIIVFLSDNFYINISLFDMLLNNKDAKEIERAISLSYKFSIK